MIKSGWIPVWKRNRDVFLKMFWVNFFLPLFEPVFYLFAFGFGLGYYVNDINGVPYKTFIMPAIIAMAAVSGSFFYTTYSSFVKMIFQKTFDAIIATPVGIDEVVIGEILWGATRGLVSGIMVMILFLALRLITVPAALAYIPLLAVLSFTFSSLGMFFTAVTTNIESFNYPIYLYFTPMMFFSGTFFPLHNMPEYINSVSRIIFPMTVAMESFRSIQQSFSLSGFCLGLIPLAHGLAFFAVSVILMRKKLVK